MSARKPRQRRQQRTQQAILDAALRIISEKGVNQLSMRAIAEQIDYSPAGLYEYFGSKEEIVGLVCHEGHLRLRKHLLQVDAALPPPEHLQALGLAYIEFALANPDHYLLMFTTPPNDSSHGGMQSDSSSFPVLLDSIRRGIEAGVFKERREYGLSEMAYSAWALVHGIAMLRLTFLSGYPADLDETDRQALLAFGRGLM